MPSGQSSWSAASGPHGPLQGLQAAASSINTPHLALPCYAGGVAVDGFGDAKVDQLKLPLHHQEVGRLQVRMHNASFMDGVHGLQGSIRECTR